MGKINIFVDVCLPQHLSPQGRPPLDSEAELHELNYTSLPSPNGHREKESSNGFFFPFCPLCHKKKIISYYITNIMLFTIVPT